LGRSKKEKDKKIYFALSGVALLTAMAVYLFSHKVSVEFPESYGALGDNSAFQSLPWTYYLLAGDYDWVQTLRAPNINAITATKLANRKNAMYILNQGLGFKPSLNNAKAFMGLGVGETVPRVEKMNQFDYPVNNQGVGVTTPCPSGYDAGTKCYIPGPGIEDDSAQSWKKFIKDELAVNFDAAEKNSGGKKIIWETGNEINNGWASYVLRGWFKEWYLKHDQEENPKWAQLGVPTRWEEYKNNTWKNTPCENGKEATTWHWCTSKGSDPVIIPYYVEYELAPMIEALRESGKSFDISLGSIVGASRQESRDWIDTALNYQVKGIFAPSLAGKKVYELVNSISIHYLTTYDFHGYNDDLELTNVNNNTYVDNSWEAALDGIYDKWMGPDRPAGCNIENIWASEESGAESTGANKAPARAIKIFSRYMYWWQKKNIAPLNGLVGLWRPDGTAEGQEPERGIDLFYNLFVNTNEKAYEPGKLNVVLGSDLLDFGSKQKTESYIFLPERTDPTNEQQMADHQKIAIVIFPKSEQTQHDLSIKDIYIQKNSIQLAGWNPGVTGDVYLTTQGSPQKLEGASVSEETGRYKISLKNSLMLSEQAVLVVSIDGQQLDGSPDPPGGLMVK
jgi:hypothetical protein